MYSSSFYGKLPRIAQKVARFVAGGFVLFLFFFKERGKKLLQGSEKWPDPSPSERVSEEREEEAEEEEGLQRGVIFRGKGLYSCSTENKLH